MLGYGVLYLGLTLVTLALVYMFHESEESKYNEVKSQVAGVAQSNLRNTTIVNELQNNIDQMTSDIRESLAQTKSMMSEAMASSAKACMDAAHSQTHCEKLRRSMQTLEAEVAAKKEPVRFSGPIQIEILRPTKKSKPIIPNIPKSLDELKGNSPEAYRPKKKLGKKVK